MKIIKAKVHGVLDYLTVIFLLLSPVLFHMNSSLTIFTCVLAIIHLLLTIFTKYDFGMIRIIPFKIHGIIELIVAVLLIGVAFWNNHTRNFLGFYYYLWLSIIFLVVFILTDFKEKKNENAAGSYGIYSDAASKVL